MKNDTIRIVLLGRCNNYGIDKILSLCSDEEFGEQIVS